MKPGKERTMVFKVIVIALTFVLLSAASFGQDAQRFEKATNSTYDLALQQSVADVQARLKALEHQIAGAQPAQIESLQKQVSDVKQAGEIRRLEILLKWAEDEGDAARISEIQRALENWRNPPRPKQLPQLPKDTTSISHASNEKNAGSSVHPAMR
jgi:hypothetical protein